MAGSDLRRAEERFAEAIECDGPERAQVIERACAGDQDLRAHVQRLIEAHEGAGGFLSEPTMAAALGAVTPGPLPMAEGPGARIGPYKLLQLIGEGGFG